MKDQFDDEAEKMAKNFVDTVHKEHEAIGGFDTQDSVETILLSTIPLAELLRDKARLDGIIKYSATWKSREICDEHLAAVREGKK